MFENISKGAFTVGYNGSNGLVSDELAYNISQEEIENGFDYDICAVWKDAHYHNPDQPKQNAEFIAYCFNLQQKYDIGLFDQAVYLLEKLVEENMCSCVGDELIEELLEQIKK